MDAAEAARRSVDGNVLEVHGAHRIILPYRHDDMDERSGRPDIMDHPALMDITIL